MCYCVRRVGVYLGFSTSSFSLNLIYILPPGLKFFGLFCFLFVVLCILSIYLLLLLLSVLSCKYVCLPLYMFNKKKGRNGTPEMDLFKCRHVRRHYGASQRQSWQTRSQRCVCRGLYKCSNKYNTCLIHDEWVPFIKNNCSLSL